MLLQSEYRNHLSTRLVWYSNGRFVSSCYMVQYSNGGLKTGPKMSVLQSKMPGFPHFQMVCLVTWQVPSENQTFKSPVSRWIWYSGVRYSDGYCMYMLNLNIWPLLWNINEWRTYIHGNDLKTGHPQSGHVKNTILWLVFQLENMDFFMRLC